MKRGGELTRKTPLRAKAKLKGGMVFTRDPYSEPLTLHDGLPKLPSIPTSLTKAARKISWPKITKARQAAKGMECQIRVPGYCPNNPETVVLCHYRLSGTSGMGMKPDDAQAAFGDDVCHAIVDGRIKTGFTYTELRLMHAEGCFRTQAIIRAESAR